MLQTVDSVSARSKTASLLTPADDGILEALLRYHMLSAQQVCRLLYSPRSITHVQTKLKHLTDLGFCLRLYLPRMSRSGSSPSIYALARRGLNHLKSRGLDIPQRFRPSEKQQSYLHLAHTLSVNDVLITAELLCQRVSGIELRAMLHERTLKHTPTYVQDGETKLAVIPDGWLDFRLADTRQMCIALEIDRGTEEERKFRRKIRGLVAWAKGPYQEKFQTTSLTVAVIATTGEKRLSRLLRWTELELSNERQDLADVFRFASVSPLSVDPESFFLSAHWYCPFGQQPVPLIDTLD